mmetsp:Transcript_34040/g.81825  ORF Transcript_34040/g.81825 Transcript_34040/m.81825 type:complete len:218 (-) Transcript_34040:1958-2611(-)
MGIGPSSFNSAGELRGAYAPPLPNVVQPPKLDPTVKKYKLTVPHDKGPGDTMIVEINGGLVGVTIPKSIRDSDGSVRRTRHGDKFTFEYSDRERVVASTLPTLPGTTIVEAKPIVWANSSYAFRKNQFNDQHEQTSMSKEVGEIMQEAQMLLLQKAVEAGCNAVLSINSNIAIDSSGEHGNSKIVVATLIGTPCVIMPSSQLPAVEAEATVIPEMLY